ncbi:MAG TPA: HAD family hydrolase [Actinomycetota bacterium]|nr:HAD family hydrolase [Actinomycetota bacterium]
MTEPVRGVLFDYGHTLVDFGRTEEALLAAYEAIRSRIEAALYIEAPEVGHLIDRVAGEVDRRVGESYAARRMEELDLIATFDDVLSQTLGLTVPADVVRHVVALDHSAYSKTITVSDDTLAVLRTLGDRGLRLGIVSNVTLLPHLMRADLNALGILSLLDATTFSSEVGTRKPDPAIFADALTKLDVDAGATVFVGDRLLDDVGGARAVGMRAVLTQEFRREEPAASDGPQPDAVIGRLNELPEVLDRLSGTG